MAPSSTKTSKVAAPKAAAKTTASKPAATKAPAAKVAPAPAKPVVQTRPSPEIRRVADLLKQVSDPTRLQVLMLLSEKERNVSELCSDLGTQSQPAVSHHLALLRHGRLIEPRRAGKHNFYGLTEAGRELAEVVNSIVEQ